ncbi:MAG: ABC transporter permease subunit [Hyphomicrobiaceae bacterium]
MASVDATDAATAITNQSEARGLPGWLIALLVATPFFALVLMRSVLPAWAVTPPSSWTIPFIDWINAIVKFLRREPFLFGYTFKDLTRAIADLVNYPLDLVEGLLITGFAPFNVPGWGEVTINPFPWVMIAGLAAVYGWYLRGPGLAALAGGCVTYMAFFGKWKLSMITLSTVLVAAPIAAIIGLLLGIAGNRSRWFNSILVPFLNILQSLPHFSYLIPVAVFIGVGHKAGTIATIIFAIPPMTRLTLLGLEGVSKEVKEAGEMAGCTRFQMIWKVEIPAARHALMVGVNQVIMQCLAMVVISAFIGAKGLGHDLLFRLQSLRIGQAFEIGIAIVLMAITLDRLSQAAVEKEPEHAPEGPFWVRHPFLTAAAGVTIFSLLAAYLTPFAVAIPRSYTVTIAPSLAGIIDHITFHFYEPLQWVRNNALIYALIPLKTAFQQVPWVALVALVAAAGWYLGGIRLALVCSAFVAFIAFSGFWSRSMITAYMVTVAVLICLLIGLPMGIWAAGTDRLRGTALWIACMLGVAFIVLGGILPIEPILWSKSETAQEPETVAMVHKVFFALIAIGAVAAPIFIWWLGGEWRAKAIKFLLDTFQTFPSFIYLLPVIMLFKVGDVAAISAIIIYAMIPVVRYTIFGLQNVPNEIVEAGLTSGCTPRQLLWKVRMPFALPEMMLGLNQTIMFALFMVIIAGFIGTTDLGQEIFRALTFNDAGKGLVVGMCVAFMGLTVDQLITAWAAKRKKALGMS